MKLLKLIIKSILLNNGTHDLPHLHFSQNNERNEGKVSQINKIVSQTTKVHIKALSFWEFFRLQAPTISLLFQLMIMILDTQHARAIQIIQELISGSIL